MALPACIELGEEIDAESLRHGLALLSREEGVRALVPLVRGHAVTPMPIPTWIWW